MGHVDESDIPRAVQKSYGPRTCTYSMDGENCSREHFARGMCQAHYMRLRRYGSCGEVAVAPGPRRVLKDHQVVMARRRVFEGVWKVKDAAEHFGVAYTTMVDALSGRTFRHIDASGFTQS